MVDCLDVPNIRHLRMAQMVGRLGGVSSASRELHTSQPAVTQALANLEAELGIQMFDRRATGTYPTELGEVFLLRVDRFFQVLEQSVGTVIEGGRGVRADRSPGGTRLAERFITATQMRSLIATSDHNDIEQSAVELGVTSTSIYRSVRELERSLGRTLLVDSAQGQVCSPTGQYLARQLRRAVREIDFGRGEVNHALGAEDLKIVVGALPMSGSYELANAVHEFYGLRPRARVRILTGDYHMLLCDLRNCRIDMQFGLLRRPEWADDIEEEALFQDSFRIVMRPGHPLTKSRKLSTEQLAEYDWIVPASGTPRRAQIEKLFEGFGKRPRFGIETSSLPMTRSLLHGSNMLTLMSGSEVKFDSRMGTIQTMPWYMLDSIPPKGITTRSDWLPTEAHELFLSCLRRATCQSRRAIDDVPPKMAVVR